MNIYTLNSYKQAIREAIREKKSLFQEVKYTFQSVAESCRLQKTYFSRMLNGDDVHLNADQLQMVMDYLAFSEEEQNFLALLHAYERAIHKTLRRRLSKQIESIRNQNLRTDKVLNHPQLNVTANSDPTYFLQPNLQLLHLLLTIPKFARDLNLAKTQLGMSSDTVDRMLRDLETRGFVERNGSTARVLQENLHLSVTSNFIKPYHTMMRSKSIEAINNSTASDAYSYSLFFSANDEARLKVQSEFFAFLDRAQLLIRDAPSERIYQIGFDLLPWTVQN